VRECGSSETIRWPPKSRRGEAAAHTGRSYVSPYNDPYVVAGQGTVAVELLHQLPDMDAIFVAPAAVD